MSKQSKKTKKTRSNFLFSVINGTSFKIDDSTAEWLIRCSRCSVKTPIVGTNRTIYSLDDWHFLYVDIRS